jgi:hyaluronan synthase
MASLFVFFVGLAWLERPYTAAPQQRALLDKLRVTVNVPLYNEDPAIAHQTLESLLAQTRLPNKVEVVDDGSSISYDELKTWWLQASAEAGIEGSWKRIANAGKRHAQLVTFEHDTTSEIFVTVDSDSLLAHNAIEEGMLPFVDPDVTSVAAIVLAMNAKQNLVTRLTDMMFLNFQLITRSGLSVIKSVLVNSGCASFYRASVVRSAFEAYRHETFLNRPVPFSDDSFLTLVAHLQGQTVQQPTCVAFTYLPERVGHHLRQQLRWFRGSTIRSIWRFRYLPMTGAAYWVHFINWFNFFLVATIFSYLLIYQPVIHQEVAPWLLLISVLISYITSFKYLAIRRSDVSRWWQFCTFLMSPLLFVWSAVVLRPLRIYGMLTCAKTGWQTRQAGPEVTVKPAALSN